MKDQKPAHPIEINHDDPMQVQREQETKPARTSTGAGETSVPRKASNDPDDGSKTQESAPAPQEGTV